MLLKVLISVMQLQNMIIIKILTLKVTTLLWVAKTFNSKSK